jgi:hypothetical protein
MRPRDERKRAERAERLRNAGGQGNDGGEDKVEAGAALDPDKPSEGAAASVTQKNQNLFRRNMGEWVVAIAGAYAGRSYLRLADLVHIVRVIGCISVSFLETNCAFSLACGVNVSVRMWRSPDVQIQPCSAGRHEANTQRTGSLARPHAHTLADNLTSFCLPALCPCLHVVRNRLQETTPCDVPRGGEHLEGCRGSLLRQVFIHASPRPTLSRAHPPTNSHTKTNKLSHKNEHAQSRSPPTPYPLSSLSPCVCVSFWRIGCGRRL